MSANKALRRLDARIKELKKVNTDLYNETCDLQLTIDGYASQASEAESQAYYIAEESRREIQRIESQARRDREEAESREYDRQRVARELKRAVDWKRITGADHFGDIERLSRKLSRGY